MTMFEIASATSFATVAAFWAIAILADAIKARQEKAAEAKNEVVFLMGNPAAGKSTVATREFGATHTFIDCDQFKASHPDYDPKNPAALHAWSSQQADAMFKAACTGGQGRWVLDGTGANVNNLLADISAARQGGFNVRLFYVRCSLETSLRRNARRDRTVPTEIVMEKAAKVESSFQIAQRYADVVTVVDNDADTM